MLNNVQPKISLNKLLVWIASILFCAYIHWSYIRGVSSKLFLAAIFALLALNMFSSRKLRLRTSGYMGIFATLIVYTCFGSVYSVNTYAAIRFVMQLALAFGFYVVMLDDSNASSQVINWLNISGIFVVSAIIVQMLFPEFINMLAARYVKMEAYFMTMELFSYGYYTGLSGFNCIAGFFAATTLGAFLFKGLFSHGKTSRVFSFAIAILGLIALVATQKRGVLLAALVALIVSMGAYYLSQRKASKFLQMLLTLILVAGLVYVVMIHTESGQLMLKRFAESDDITSGRSDKYAYVLERAQDSMVFGYGTGSMSVSSEGNAHNIYLQILYDHGVIGLMIYGLFFLMPLIKCINNLRIGNRSEKMHFSLFVQVLFLGYGMTGNPLYDFCIFAMYLISVLLMENNKIARGKEGCV